MKSKHARWGLIQLLTIIMVVAAGTAFAAGEQLMHNSDNLGTKYGTWGVAGGKYGAFTCTTCHSTAVVGTNNIKRVKGTLTAPLGSWSSSKAATVSVVFNNMTGYGNDAGGHATSTRVCEVCHSKTTVHRYNTAGQTDLDHKSANQSDCTSCHSHADAFKGKGCTSCHGSFAGSGNTITTGKHTAHIDNASTLGANFGCADCHAKSVISDEAIKSAPTAHQNGTYGDYSGARAGGSYAAGNCSNVYCHTNGKGGAPATPVNWATGPSITTCTACHGGDSGGNTSQAGEPVYVGGNSHIKHVGTTGANATCQYCHAGTMSGTGLNASGKHINRFINVTSGNGKSFGYAGGTKTCSNISCHSGGGMFTAADVVWGTTMPADCTGCHGNEVNAATKLSGAHNAHLNNAAAGGSFGCKDCHAPTITDAGNRVIANANNHGNTVVNYSGAKAGKNKNCSNIYCHSNGKGTYAVIPAWVGGTANCQSCHATAAFSGSYTHATHLGKGATCQQCHSATTTATDTITGAANHIDGTVNLLQGGSFGTTPKTVEFTWAGGGTCNNISCHSPKSASPYNNTATWGVKANCDTCHPKTGLSGAHQVHMGALDLTSSTVYYNMTANRTPVANDTVRKHGFGCAECHPMDAANHLDGAIEVDLNRVNVAGVSTLRFLNASSAGYTMDTTKKCSNIYCHSNASRLATESNVKANTSLAWTDTYAAHPELDRCAQCHGNQPTTGAHVAHAISNHADNIYNGTNGKVGFSGTGNSAHGNPNTTTTITCYICHAATVDPNSHGNDKNDRCKGCHDGTAISKGVARINNIANHVNGSREISFAPIYVRSKAQVRPASFRYYSGVWQRSYYKNMTSLAFDISKVPLDTATMWHPSTPSESNCTNLACHNGYKAVWNMANFNDPNKCMDCHFKL
jgi:predicted CxxxxCH...CXXCH cytochrome family protein